MAASTVFMFLSVRLMDAGYDVAFIACTIITFSLLGLAIRLQNNKLK